MKVLITGAAGFTARHLCKRLRQEGSVSITGTDIVEQPPGDTDIDHYHQANLTNPKEVRDLLSEVRPDWIFHLAGIFRGDVTAIYQVNLMGTLNLLETIKEISPETAILLVGSAAEYGIWPSEEMPLAENHPCEPINAYGSSKLAMTQVAQTYFRQSGTKSVIARPFNIIGAGMPNTLLPGAIAERAKAALETDSPEIAAGNLASQRDFIAIEDAVDAYVNLLKTELWGEVYNICSGAPRTIDSVIQTLLSFSPRPISLVKDPALVHANDPPLVTGDFSKAQQAFGFTPKVKLEDALKAAWQAVVPA